MRAWLLVLLLAACAGGDAVDHGEPPTEEPPTEVERCDAPPLGFVAWRSANGLVNVSKKLNGTASGVALQAQVQHVDALPGVVDFGAEQLLVREDLTLCLLPASANAE